MPSVELPDDLITPTQAARILHAHVSTVYRFIRSGKLKAYWRAGTRHLVSEADVRALFEPTQARPEIETSAEIRQKVAEARAELERMGIRTTPREKSKPKAAS